MISVDGKWEIIKFFHSNYDFIQKKLKGIKREGSLFNHLNLHKISIKKYC